MHERRHYRLTIALDGKYKDAFPTKTFSSIKLFSLNYSKDWMHTVACPDRIVHYSALNMKMKTFWSLNLDFHSDSVCNLLYTLQSSILFIHIWIWSCTVLKPNYMLHVVNTSNYIWPPSNHVYDYYFISSLFISEKQAVFCSSGVFLWARVASCCQVLWSDQQPGGDHSDPVWGSGGGKAQGHGASQGKPPQVNYRQQDLLLCHWWGYLSFNFVLPNKEFVSIRAKKYF